MNKLLMKPSNSSPFWVPRMPSAAVDGTKSAYCCLQQAHDAWYNAEFIAGCQALLLAVRLDIYASGWVWRAASRHRSDGTAAREETALFDDLDNTQFVCFTCGSQRGGATTATLTGAAGDICAKGAACTRTSQLHCDSNLQVRQQDVGKP